MKFKQYLLFETKNDIKQLDALFYNEYSDAYKLKAKLYRGSKREIDSFVIQDSSKFNDIERVEKIKDKIITWNQLKQIAPEWNKFPNREKSIFFTSKEQHASQFSSYSGTKYFIFPHNDAKIAALNSDFNFLNYWPSPQNILKSFNYNRYYHFIFNLAMCILKPIEAREYGIAAMVHNRTKWLIENSEKLEKFLKNKKLSTGNEIDEFLFECHKKYVEGINREYGEDKKYTKKEHRLWYNDDTMFKVLCLKYNCDIKAFLIDLLSPINNSFKIIKTFEIDKYIDANYNPNCSSNEFWTEDKCLIVNPKLFKKYVGNSK